jgi:hypothetical protein
MNLSEELEQLKNLQLKRILELYNEQQGPPRGDVS